MEMFKNTITGYEIKISARDKEIDLLKTKIKYLTECLEKKTTRSILIKDVRSHFEKIEMLDKGKFLSSSIYSRIEPFLSEELVNQLNNNSVYLFDLAGTIKINNFNKLILKEISNLEILWELI